MIYSEFIQKIIIKKIYFTVIIISIKRFKNKKLITSSKLTLNDK